MERRRIVLRLEQEVQEVDSFVAEDSLVAEACKANQLSEGMRGHFTV